MAKPLNERLTTALLNPRVRSADLESLIAEVTLERDNRTGALAQATEDSVNFGLSDDDRDAAAQRSERARREVLALGSVLEKLQDKLTSRIATEQKQASEERRTELLAERDRIAEQLKDEWPALEASIVALLSAVMSNEAQMRAAGIHEANAEAVARGVPGNFSRGPVMIRQLTKLALPSFADVAALAWPAPVKSGPHWTEMARQNRRSQAEAEQRRVAAEQAAWAEYSVSAGTIDRITEISCQGGKIMTVYPENMTGAARFDSSARQCWLHASEVARLRGLGVSVELVA